MTGRINYSPEADQQLDELDDWITKAASAKVARRFVTAILSRIDDLLIFPYTGSARGDIRPGMRTITYKKNTLIAYEVEGSAKDLVVTVIGVFHGGQDWETALRVDSAETEEN